MAKSIGTIEVILGTGTLINLQGTEKNLTNNLKLYEDDVLATGDNTTLIIKLSNGKTISLGANRVLTLDDSVIKEEAYVDDEVQAEVEKIQTILAESNEIEDPEETAAGESMSAGNVALSVESIDTHHNNTGHAQSNVLNAFTSTSQALEEEEGDTLIIPLDTQNAVLGFNPIITNNPTPTISGTINDPTATIIVTVGSKEYLANNNGDGTWSAIISDALKEGDSTIKVVATDPSGNTSSVTTTITIDTLLDDSNNSNNGNVITIDTITDDTGVSGTDFITTDTSLKVSGSYDNETENTLSVTLDGKEFIPDITDNYWEVNLEGTSLSDGVHEIIATVKDLAGNEVSTSKTITIDTNGSDTTGTNGNTNDGSDATITLDTISDDNIINKLEASNSVTISGSTTAVDGSLVSLYVGNSSLAQLSVTNGTFSYTVPADMFNAYSDGIYQVRAEVLADKAGNIASSLQTVTLDTQITNSSSGGLESHELITIDSITQDTGSSNSDFITSDTTLTVKGTFDNANGHELQIEVGGTLYTPTISGNNWEITLPELTDGEKNLDITISDTSGNTETITQTIVIDTLADIGDGSTLASITLDDISEGFLNANEAGNILTLSGTSNVIGSNVLITLNDGAFTATTVQNDGTYSIDVSTTEIAKYEDGVYNVKATIVTDDAGNSISANQNVTLDTTLDSGSDYTGTDLDGNPANITIDTITEDTGIANDFITTDKNIKISGTFNAEAGNTLVVKLDSTIYSTEDASPKLTVDGNNWVLNLEETTLSDAQYSVTAIVKDSAGNSETTQQNIQIVNSTDIGVINLNEISDNYINAQEATQTLTITGTSSQLGQTVNFTLNGSPLIINSTAITTVVAADGTFSIEIPADTFTAYNDGEYTVQASVTATNDGNIYTDSENVILDRTNNNTTGGGTATNGDDATITLSSIGDGFINAQEASTGLLLTGTTTAVEGTPISFIFESTTGDKYPVTQNSNGQIIAANADGTFSAFIKLGDLTGIDNTNILITAEVVADKAGNIASSDAQVVTVDLSAGELTTHSSDSSVYESALDIGSSPSTAERTTSGNLFAGDDIGNSTLSSFSSNGQEATLWNENSDILTLTTNSGTLFIATTATTQDGVSYNAGDYLYVLENASSATTDTFTYTLNDSAGNSASADLNISIVDDKATINADGAIHKYLSADTSSYSTNLILTLDVSGSMNWDADGSAPGDYHYEYSGFLNLNRTKVSDYDESTIRIDLAKDALKNLIDKYSELGDVNVQVISFSDTATASNMLNATDAKAYIDSLSADGATNYDAAIDKAQENPASAYPDANTTQYYFVSDGEPNNNVSQDSYNQWQDYIKASPIDKTYAIGVGDTVDVTQLNNISGNMASDPDLANERSGIDGDTILIHSITDLNDTLIQTVNSTVITGELTSFDADGTAIHMGADGGHINQISIFAQDGSIAQTLEYNATNPSQTLSTPLGGTLNIDFDSGSYTYTIDYKDNVAGKEERIDVSVVDNDGVSLTNSVYFNLQETPNDNLSFSSNEIDGGLGFDTLILGGAQTLDFDNTSNLKNIEAIDMNTGDNTIVNLDVNDVISMTDTNNKLFIYGDSQDGVMLDASLTNQGTTQTDTSGKVFDVYSDANATVTLNIEQEIVVS